MRSLPLLAALATLACAPLAYGQTQTCSTNAPQVSWTLGTENGDGTFNDVGVQNIQNMINAAECECATNDLYLIGRVTMAVNTPISPQVWVGTSCNTITSQPTNCEQVNADVSQANFYSGAGASNAPAQHIPVQALIDPKTTQNSNTGMFHQCISTASLANSMFILFPFDPSNPDYCSIALTAKTSPPAAAVSLTASSGDTAIVLDWTAPPVGTPDSPVTWQVLCADTNGQPIPGQGAYGFSEAANYPHQLAYTACVDPSTHSIQRRYLALTTGSTGVDGGTTTTTADLGTTSAPIGSGTSPASVGGGALGIEADPLDGGTVDLESTDLLGDDLATATGGSTAALEALGTLDKKFVVSDPIAVVGTSNEVRVPGLTNGLQYTCVVLAIDNWGNATKSNYASAEPKPVQDLYRRFLDAGGQPQGFCFIATAAYGSYQHPFVKVLRDFRDEALLPTEAGRAFVAWYYRTSPPFADAIRERPVARFFVRIALWPLIGLAFAHLHLAAWEEIFLAFALLLLAFRRPVRALLAGPAVDVAEADDARPSHGAA